MDKLDAYLKDIESRLIPEQEERLIEEWTAFSKGEWSENTFHPQRSEFIPPSLEWPDININDALASNEVMILDQFHNVSKQISSPMENCWWFGPTTVWEFSHPSTEQKNLSCPGK